MKKFLWTLLVLSVILGGIIWLGYFSPLTTTVVTTTQEVIENVTPEVKEPTAEEKQFAEIMKVKEQEAKLEAKRNVQKEELKVKSADFEAQINALKAERDAYVSQKETEIKATEAELASFIKATALSKN